MPATISALLLTMLQVGPAPIMPPASPIPDELYEQRRMNRAKPVQPEAEATDTALTECLSQAEADPEGVRRAASAWFNRANLAQKPAAAQCLGQALVQLGLWEDAENAFLTGRDSTLPAAQLTRAQLGAMAGNAALAADNPAGALAILERAQGDADAAGNDVLKGEVALDRARALVALQRTQDAGNALTMARLAVPDNAQAWLLSATLSRRNGDLANAQQQIETAARLAPTDAEIGLEAGVIAVLSGRDDAARKSWNSVLELAPDTPFAETAKNYLTQLGEPGAGK